MSSSSSLLKRVFTNRLVLFLAAILLIIFLSGFVKAWLKDRSIEQEIQALEQERDKLEQNKLHLLNNLEEIKSDAFIEKEAREKFALQKPGEKTVVIVDDNNKIIDTIDRSGGLKKIAGLSNPAKWWDYFFAP